ncbi:MAG: hypothetical protein HDT08_01305 [Bacteroidales bacterium]|nr:hypothetical protein [Bacteroidales bacterium]
MIGSDYIQLQNQGNILSNLRLLLEMDNSEGYADKHGYFSKAAVAEIASNALIITSGCKVGEDISEIIHSTTIEESNNSPLQNAKARMQLLRVLGLVSSDYGSEIYAITRLGRLVYKQVLGEKPNFSLLRELFLNINSTTEIYEHNCDVDFACYLGYGICYAFFHLDYKIATDEMPILTSYDIRDIDAFVKDALIYREADIKFPETNPHFPKRKNGNPLKNVSNLTRAINQILKVCGVIKPRVVSVKGRKKNYYECTIAGVDFVDRVMHNFKKLQFISAHKFRKINNISKQKELCYSTFQNLLCHGDIEPLSSIITDYRYIVFSPYQMIPETNVEWFLGGALRPSPEIQTDRLKVINSQITMRDLRLKDLYFSKTSSHVSLNSLDQSIIKYIQVSLEESKSIDEITDSICQRYKTTAKNEFYPLVHSLFRILGIECLGEVGRFDGYCKFGPHVIPIEIKSFTETPTYNLKGLRQAVENKIMSYQCSVADDLAYASFVVGFAHPSSNADILNFIDSAYENFGIKIIASDLASIVKMAVKSIAENISVNFKKILTNYGLLQE